METLVFLFRIFVRATLETLMLAMLVRSLMSFFFFGEENKFTNFIFHITEPFIIPVRYVLYRLNILQDSPIDFAFFITAVIIAMVSVFI